MGKFREFYMQQLEQKAEDRFIRLPELIHITGRKRSQFTETSRKAPSPNNLSSEEDQWDGLALKSTGGCRARTAYRNFLPNQAVN
jgi:predicted DNA-binding transcriptional regulator AlpA